MVADLSRITSLDRPPDDWDWRGDDRGRRLRALDGCSTLTWTNRQARSPIEPRMTADLPVLVPGRDRLPTLCSACGSALLRKEPPLGEHQRGMMTCGVCGEQLCWLGPPLDGPRMRPMSAAAPEAPVAQPAPEVAPEQAPSLTEAYRRPGCTDRCLLIEVPLMGADGLEVLEVHDIDGHLAFQREVLRPGVLRTGPLVVDLDARRTTVGGAEVSLSPIEEGILTVLSSRVGHACTILEIVERVWGAGQLGLEQANGGNRWHITRVHMTRLRAKLGPARGLVTTLPGRGYRLEALPPVEPEPAP